MSAMNRRARLRLRGISLLDGALRWKLPSGASERAESGACCHGSHAGLPIQPQMRVLASEPAFAAQWIVDDRECVDPRDGGMACADIVDSRVAAQRIIDEHVRLGSHDGDRGCADIVDSGVGTQRIVDEQARVDSHDGDRGCTDSVDPAVRAQRIVDERERVDPRDVLSDGADSGGDLADVARSAASEPHHGRELRALRTSRARRLAIALGLPHGARLE
jgi:hypothetical protein